jgi:hypothetical protein
MRMNIDVVSKISSGALCAFALISAQTALASSKRAGHIALVRGPVFILSAKNNAVIADPEGKRGRSTQKDAPFYEGEIIQTRDGARVKLVFDEGQNEIVLGAATSLLIERAGNTQPGTELSLNNGSVRSVVNRKYSGNEGDVFEIRTPNSVAGVRGTIFNVLFDAKKNHTKIFTEQGSVSVSQLQQGLRIGAQEIRIDAGKFSEIEKDQAPTPPRNYDITQPNVLADPLDAPETSQTDAEGASSTINSATPNTSSNTSEENPAVAIVPKSVNTIDNEDNRSPASVNAPTASETATPQFMAPSNSEMANRPTINPFDIVNQQSDAMRRQAEEELRRKRLIEGNLSEIPLKIQ